MIQITNKQIVIDGKPVLILCGEIHYYRLRREDWLDRIQKLKASGCNAVASYVPWLCHEPIEGCVDLDGSTRPELDLGAFIDLCHDNDLYFFVRPGPFIMAEMKNEGIPFWVYDKHPEIVPVSWDGKPITTRTIDYLMPGFLHETRKWYEAVMAVIKPRLYTRGGNIIAVQLDNEIGMLSWVSNSPDLTDALIADFVSWLKRHYEAGTLAERYPFELDGSSSKTRAAIRSPQDAYAGQLLHDLGVYMRSRFARYVAELRSYAEAYGVKDVPFVINIHGTGGGRGFTYPIGISQLYESYTQAPGYLSGSDIYFGNLTMDNFQDLYLCNAFMDAVHLPDQPLTSVEFECGDGNYGSTLGGRYDPSAADFKTRMCIAQGNRLLNYYLFAGGVNYRLDPEPDDGNGRVAFTGERHGFAAPVSPEGELNYTFPRMARAIHTMMAMSDKLAVAEEERDNVAFAFIPDYYMTEYCYKGSAAMTEIVRNIEANRAHGAWEIVARAMLLGGYRFGAADIQNKPLDPSATPVLVLPSAGYMDGGVQRKLAEYLAAGGGVLLFGEVPRFDMEGNPCSVLAEALSVEPKGSRQASEKYHLSLCAEGWAAPRPEVRAHFAQTFEIIGGVEPILRVYGSGEVSGFEASVGKGKAIVIASAYECDVAMFRMALERLGSRAKLTHDNAQYGIFMTSSATKMGERFIHLLNLDGFDKKLHVFDESRCLFGGRELELQAKDGVMLPVNVTIGDVRIVYSTAEVGEIADGSIMFRLTQSKDVIALQTERTIVPSEEYDLEVSEGTTYIFSCKHAKVDDRLIVRFQA